VNTRILSGATAHHGNLREHIWKRRAQSPLVSTEPVEVVIAVLWRVPKVGPEYPCARTLRDPILRFLWETDTLWRYTVYSQGNDRGTVYTGTDKKRAVEEYKKLAHWFNARREVDYGFPQREEEGEDA